MGNMGSFFIRYMMQVAFILNVVYLFDIPHYIVKTYRRCLHRYRRPQYKKFKDTWYFDLGYFQAYCLTIFFLAFLFAVVIPLITVFAFLFFFLRFNFDKYNQTFVYFSEFEAKGRLKRHVIYILLSIVMLSQLLNFAFLKVLTGVDNLLALGVTLVCLQIGVLLGLKIRKYL